MIVKAHEKTNLMTSVRFMQLTSTLTVLGMTIAVATKYGKKFCLQISEYCS